MVASLMGILTQLICRVCMVFAWFPCFFSWLSIMLFYYSWLSRNQMLNKHQPPNSSTILKKSICNEICIRFDNFQHAWYDFSLQIWYLLKMFVVATITGDKTKHIPYQQLLVAHQSTNSSASRESQRWLPNWTLCGEQEPTWPVGGQGSGLLRHSLMTGTSQRSSID